jgi:BASS family bile acid:Na+ symporter
VLLGIGLHHATPRLVNRLLPAAPLVSVTAIVLIVSSIVGQKADQIMHSAGVLLLAVALLHAGGFFFGYLFARVIGYPTVVRRTISVEVGMQNSGLGAALAQNNFPQLPLAPVPCAISAVCHSVMGSFLAGIWRLRPPTDAAPADALKTAASPSELPSSRR